MEEMEEQDVRFAPATLAATGQAVPTDAHPDWVPAPVTGVGVGMDAFPAPQPGPRFRADGLVYRGRPEQSQGLGNWEPLTTAAPEREGTFFGTAVPGEPLQNAVPDRKVYNAVEIARIVWAMRQIREQVAGTFDRKDWSEISDERADAHIQEIKEALRMYGAAGVEEREFTLAWNGE